MGITVTVERPDSPAIAAVGPDGPWHIGLGMVQQNSSVEVNSPFHPAQKLELYIASVLIAETSGLSMASNVFSDLEDAIRWSIQRQGYDVDDARIVDAINEVCQRGEGAASARPGAS